MTTGIYWFYQASKDRALYVGSSKHIKRRFWQHKSELKHNRHRNPRLQNIWNKYGKSEIQMCVLEETDVSQLVEREQFWMDAIRPICNIAVSADNSMRGRKFSVERCKLMSERARKLVRTEEHKRNLSAAQVGRIPWNKGKKGVQVAWNKGGHLSEEQKTKISHSSMGNTRGKGRIVSEETRRNISAALKGRKSWNKGLHVRTKSELAALLDAGQGELLIPTTE